MPDFSVLAPPWGGVDYGINKLEKTQDE